MKIDILVQRTGTKLHTMLFEESDDSTVRNKMLRHFESEVVKTDEQMIIDVCAAVNEFVPSWQHVTVGGECVVDHSVTDAVKVARKHADTERAA